MKRLKVSGASRDSPHTTRRAPRTCTVRSTKATTAAGCHCRTRPNPFPRTPGQSLDVRENVAILTLPADLLRDTPLHRLGVDPHLLGKDGLLQEMEGSAE